MDKGILAILEYIRKKGIQSGQQLPVERKLAKELKLSRTELRDGLAVLQYLRLVERKTKIGTTFRGANNLGNRCLSIAFIILQKLGLQESSCETSGLKLAYENALKVQRLVEEQLEYFEGLI